MENTMASFRTSLSVSAASLVACTGFAKAQSFGEGFESGLPATWVIHNQSNPVGTTTWNAGTATQIGDVQIGPHSGANLAFVDYECGSSVSTLSNWLILPQSNFNNGDSFTFWTRSTDGVFPDRLQVRMSSAGASTNTGSSATDTGDFTSLLLDINPTYSNSDFPTGFPFTYHAYTVSISGLAGTTSGRLAFRYFVEDGGPGGSRSDCVGIDDVAYISSTDVTGACCLGDGSCALSVGNVCTGQGGTYRGDGSTCANAGCPSGACCVNLGCAVSTSSACAAQGGTYHGDGSTCATANCPGPTAGPDVIVGEVYDVSRDGVVGAITAYSIGTDSCNLGDIGVVWFSGTNQHPVISGNMFRLKTVSGAARFEQIGLSWYKHGFFATNANYCSFAGSCNTTDGTHLGPHGCSDVYTSGLNGDPGNMGPRSEANGTTGVFTYPTVNQGNDPSAIGKRCQVFSADVDPAQNAGALYFADAHYLVPDDAQYSHNGANATNGLNNYSYRQISASTLGNSAPSFVGTTHMQLPGIQAWKDQDSTITQVNAEYIDSSVGPNIVARFIVSAKATSLGGGQYHYEYAVYNINADRSGGSFSVPIPAGAVVTNVGFHAPFYHSGEVFDNTAWDSAVTSSAVTWTPHPFSPAANANAIRWGTMYNFRFDANIAPGTGSATLGLFKVGTPTSISVSGLPTPGVQCYANCDGSTSAPVLNVADFTCFLQKFGIGDPYANCDGSTSVPVLNVGDFTCFLQKFALGCSTP
jgi:hypothetical protein